MEQLMMLEVIFGGCGGCVLGCRRSGYHCSELAITQYSMCLWTWFQVTVILLVTVRP